MTRSLFITGAGGFVGRHLLKGLNLDEYDNVYCLGRGEALKNADLSDSDKVTYIQGSLHDRDKYGSYLASSDVVIHLAAATGKTTRDEYFYVNTKGTECLIEECQKRGVRSFLYVSTIAVKFKDLSHYHYAQSKQAAEDLVKTSGLDYTIVRPTIVLGPGSPIWAGLAKLARAPVSIIFGDGRARIQPIDVDDLVEGLLIILGEKIFEGKIYDLGGPEVLTMEELIALIHQGYSQKPFRRVHLPLGFLIPLLSLMEKRFLSYLPFTAGQLASFRNDGTIDNNELVQRLHPRMKRPGEMVARILGHLQKSG